MIFSSKITLAHWRWKYFDLNFCPNFKQQFLSSHFPLHPQNRSAGGRPLREIVTSPLLASGMCAATAQKQPSGQLVGPPREHWSLQRGNHISWTPQQKLLSICPEHVNHEDGDCQDCFQINVQFEAQTCCFIILVNKHHCWDVTEENNLWLVLLS